MHLLATYEAYGLVDAEIRSLVGAEDAKVPGSPFGMFISACTSSVCVLTSPFPFQGGLNGF